MRTLIFIIMVSFAVSCSRAVYVPTRSHEVRIDTVTQTLADSATLEALFECDSLGRVRLAELYETKGKLATQQLTIKDGHARITTRWQTKYIDRVTELRDTTTVIELKEVVREVKHIPSFYKWCMWIAIAAAAVGAFKLVRKFI